MDPPGLQQQSVLLPERFRKTKPALNERKRIISQPLSKVKNDLSEQLLLREAITSIGEFCACARQLQKSRGWFLVVCLMHLPNCTSVSATLNNHISISINTH